MKIKSLIAGAVLANQPDGTRIDFQRHIVQGANLAVKVCHPG